MYKKDFFVLKVAFASSLLLWATMIRTFAQEIDNTTWAKIGVRYEVLSKLTLSGNLEWRTEENWGMTDRWGLDIGGSYSLYPCLKIGVGYEIHYRNLQENGWKFRHRYHVDATFSRKVLCLKISLRERFQHTFSAEEKEFRLRSRLKLAYDIADSGFEPYVSMEMYNGLGREERWDRTRLRYRGGLSFPLVSQWEAEAFYCRQWERDGIKNILGIECIYRF